jgi:hypothetical protein
LSGFPIASGVIEGACRHLFNDRLDITGARWGLMGAESILKLRSIKSSGDFESYWEFHKQQLQVRLHRGFKVEMWVNKLVERKELHPINIVNH